MPRKTSMQRRSRRGGGLRLAGGGGARAQRIMKFLKKAHGFLRKHKALSRVGSVYAKSSFPHAGKVAKAMPYVRKAGYGRRKCY